MWTTSKYNIQITHFLEQIKYKHNTTDDLLVLTLPNCTETWRRISMNGTECKFDNFLHLVQPYIIENLDHECAIKSIVEEYIGITVLGTWKYTKILTKSIVDS